MASYERLVNEFEERGRRLIAEMSQEEFVDLIVDHLQAWATADENSDWWKTVDDIYEVAHDLAEEADVSPTFVVDNLMIAYSDGVAAAVRDRLLTLEGAKT